jgi:agmatinase
MSEERPPGGPPADRDPPVGRWVNRPGEPIYAGVGATYAKVPLVDDRRELGGADVVVLGAPIDESTSGRPGTRFGPRAIRLADVGGGRPWKPHMELGIDPFEVLTVVDYGDAPVLPADLEGNHRSLREHVGHILEGDAIPVVLGGDHSILYPNVAAAAEHHGRGTVGIVHFDAHADDAEEVWGLGRGSHGTPVRYLVDEGLVRGEHVVQVGLRGPWPGPNEFAWAREQGLVWFTAGEIWDRGFDTIVDEVVELSRAAPNVWLSVDIDVVDPAFAPGTGTPEPGGLSARELLVAVRRICREVGFCGMEVIEVSPPYDHAEITSLLANRVVLEALSGLALHRSSGDPRPERPKRRE